ncbi:MAG TPA: sugar kinase [Thermoanaerobaculia bacterium]|nr:sugar kinase [Thermoanaerobaculia bacterium]
MKPSASQVGLELRSKESCTFDILSLGEVMLRLDPGEGRIRTTRQLRVWEGGGEYNVARGLRRCFGLRAAVVTAIVRNEVGLLLEDLILQGGVDTSLIRWVPFDGIGRSARNGLNFTERGFGIRGAVGCSDRGHSASSQLRVGDVDWEHLFGKLGVRWFHTGGIFAALSETTGDVVIEAARVAKKHGTVVSYDLNYRASLWSSFGGLDRCRSVNRAIAPWLDVILGNEEDFSSCLGLEVEGVDENLLALDVSGFKSMIETAVATYPNLKAVAATLRAAKSATINDWGAISWCNGAFYAATERPNLEILDRVGGGDSFASGYIYGLMELGDAARAVEYGAAHGALAMTTPGDTTMASLAEVEKVVRGGGARVDR